MNKFVSGQTQVPADNVLSLSAIASRIRRMARVVPNWLLPDVLLPFVATRVILCFVGLLTINLLPNLIQPGKWEETSQALINMWSRWDAGWYLSIARQGYAYNPGEQSSVAFFPLYPMLMRLVAVLLGRQDGGGMLIAGILVSNVSLLIALIYLVKLLREDLDAATTSRSVFYLLIFPTSFFLSAVYTELLFLMLTVAAFYHARREQWWAAGLVGGLAALTRPPGILLLAPLVYEYLVCCRFDARRVRPDVAAIALVPAGMGIYIAYLYWRFHSGLIFLQAQSAWCRKPMAPWELLNDYISMPLEWHAPSHSFLDLSFTVLIGILVARCWGRLRTSYALYISVCFGVMLCSGTLGSIMRFGIDFFPIFMILALAGRSPSFDRAYTISALGLGAFLMSLFANWNWVA